MQKNGLSGYYRGVVVEHLPHAYCRIWIPAVYPDSWKNDIQKIPPAEQAAPLFAGTNTGNGVFTYPNIGSSVWCFFANGDQNLPVYFAASLGGENAYGQHEIILNNKKSQDDLSNDSKLSSFDFHSDKHLITSGKTHIEWFENGKISAIVVDPIRTDALVNFDDDEVTSRPLWDKVNSQQISNINCQLVLDNKYDDGTISSSTHSYFPENFQSEEIISAEQKLITTMRSGTRGCDHQIVRNNSGYNDACTVSSMASNFTRNTTTVPTKETVQEMNNVKNNITSYHLQDIVDGRNDFSAVSSWQQVSSYTYINGNTNQTITEFLKDTNDGETSYSQTVPGTAEIKSKTKCNHMYTYVNSETSDEKVNKTKKSVDNQISFADDSTFALRTSDKLDLLDQDLKIAKVHTDKKKTIKEIAATSENEIVIRDIFNDHDIMQIGSSTIDRKTDNSGTVEIGTYKDAHIKQQVNDKTTLTINGAVKQYDTVCVNNMLASEGKVEISITDNLNHTECVVEMLNSGVVRINASTSINIVVPTMNITGVDCTMNFDTLALTAGKINVLGQAGDVKVGNVSLLNHKHQETQAGDIVAPQPTLIAKASN